MQQHQGIEGLLAGTFVSRIGLRGIGERPGQYAVDTRRQAETRRREKGLFMEYKKARGGEPGGPWAVLIMQVWT